MPRAFSLVELVIVIAIIVTLGAIAAPRYALSATRYRCDAAMRRVAADLEYARAFARSSGTTVTVTFDVGAEAYEISGVDGLRIRTDTYRVELDEGPYNASLFSAWFDAFLVPDDPAAIIFDPYGVPDSGGIIVLAIGTETRMVTVGASGVVTTSP